MQTTRQRWSLEGNYQVQDDKNILVQVQKSAETRTAKIMILDKQISALDGE